MPELGQRVVEQVVGAAIERSGGNDLVARRRQRDDDEGFGGLSGGQRQPGDSAFERGDALLEDVGRRVHDAGVDVAELLQGEESRGVVGIVEHVGRGLVDRHGARLGCGIDVLAAVDGERVEVEGWLSVAGTHCCCSPRFLMFPGTSGSKTKRPTIVWTVGRLRIFAATYCLTICRSFAQPTDRHGYTCTWP